MPNKDGALAIFQHSEFEKPLSNVPGVGIELLGVFPIERSRAGKIDFNNLRYCSRPWCHDDDSVGEKYRFVDAMRDENRGLPFFKPKALQIEIHLIARQRIESAKGSSISRISGS